MDKTPATVTDSNEQSHLHPFTRTLSARDERLAALKDLVDYLAHDFNNMLVPLLGYVALLKEELPPESSAMLYTTRMEASARKTEALLETVMGAVHPGRRFNPTAGELSLIVRRVVEAWQSALPRTAQIAVKMSLVPCPLVFDEALMTHLLQHLLSNARYAMALGGTLNVTLRPPVPVLEGLPETITSAAACELVIADTGIGMPPAILQRACEPFFTTRPRNQAAGLGLTSVHSIAHLHGGKVILESAEDIGTKVTLWLPRFCADGTEANTPTGMQAAPSMGVRGARVLVVDDDPLVLEIVKACLQRLPVEVSVAPDGAQALKMFQRHQSEFRVVVSDICMPNMNGLELYEQIRQLDPDIPVVWISGDPEAGNNEALARLGAKRPVLLRKPFGLKVFAETIRAQLS